MADSIFIILLLIPFLFYISLGLRFLVALPLLFPFLVYVGVTRDPLAPTDAYAYFDLINGVDRISSPILFKMIADMLNLISFNQVDLAFQFFTYLPILIIILCCAAYSAIFPLALFACSESFVLLSFNGLRQGVATCLAIAAIGVILYPFARKVPHRLTYARLLTALLLLIFASTIHPILLALTALSCGVIAFRKVSPYLVSIVKGALPTRLLAIIVYTVIAVALLCFLDLAALNLSYLKMLAYLTRGETYNSGILGSVYRVAYCSLIGFIFYNDKKGWFSVLPDSHPFRITVTSIYISLSFISLFGLLFAHQVLTRFSYMWLVPAAILLLTPVSRQSRIILAILFLFLSVVTYSSTAVLYNLYGFP